MLIGVDVSCALRAHRTGTERYALEIVRHMLQLPEASDHTWRLYSDMAPSASPLSRVPLDPRSIMLNSQFFLVAGFGHTARWPLRFSGAHRVSSLFLPM